MPVATPEVVLRADWNARDFNGSPVIQPHYKRLTLHHAAGFPATTLAKGKSQLRAIQRLHQRDNGWSDIGYHFLIDAAGNIYQGRPFASGTKLTAQTRYLVGAHVAGANSGNLGVCLLGCFHPHTNPASCNDVLTGQAKTSLVTLFAFLCQSTGLRANAIMGHSDQGATACPGDNLRRRFDEVRLAVNDLLDDRPDLPVGDADGSGSELLETASDDRWTSALKQLSGADVMGASNTTARQDGLAVSGVAASRQMAATDLSRVLAHESSIRIAGALTDVPPAVLAAIASRESRAGAALAADGTGDHGNGFGIMQIDRRFHQLQGDPHSREHIVQAAEILASFRRQVARKHASWRDSHLLKGAIVAYNTGVNNVRTIGGMDRGTTGDDYGADVVARAQFYLEQGFG